MLTLHGRWMQKAVKDKGLDEMLAEATKENPLDKPTSSDFVSS